MPSAASPAQGQAGAGPVRRETAPQSDQDGRRHQGAEEIGQVVVAVEETEDRLQPRRCPPHPRTGPTRAKNEGAQHEEDPGQPGQQQRGRGDPVKLQRRPAGDRRRQGEQPLGPHPSPQWLPAREDVGEVRERPGRVEVRRLHIGVRPQVARVGDPEESVVVARAVEKDQPRVAEHGPEQRRPERPRPEHRPPRAGLTAHPPDIFHQTPARPAAEEAESAREQHASPRREPGEGREEVHRAHHQQQASQAGQDRRREPFRRGGPGQSHGQPVAREQQGEANPGGEQQDSRDAHADAPVPTPRNAGGTNRRSLVASTAIAICARNVSTGTGGW